MGILFAAIDQDDDSKLFPGNQPDIRGCIIETARLIDNDEASVIVDLPGECLAAARAYGEHATLRHCHRIAQERIDRELAKLGGKQGGEITRRGEHLPGARKIEIALLVARAADRVAVHGIALHGPAHECRIPVVGVLDSVADAFHFSAFRNGLSEVGYIIGHNVVLDVRSTTQYDQLPALAADLVSSHPAVLVALGGPATPAVKAASTTIPIVFSIGGDPVELGFVANIGRPGGNVTGTTFACAEPYG
jgi:hypothetical protein